MNMGNLSRQLRLVLRGEMLMAQARLSLALRKAAVTGLALLFAGLGLVFLNIGLFAWAGPIWGPVWTPVGLGLVNLALAAAALAAAAWIRPGADMALAAEIRGMAGDALEAELRSAPLAGAFGGLGGLSGSGGERAAVATLLVPAVSAIIRAMAKRKAAPSDG